MTLSNDQVAAIRYAKILIESFPGCHITIPQLCKWSGLSASILTRGFKFSFQISVLQYHLFISMEYAKAMIEDGMSIKEVALRLNYHSISNFNKAFRKVFEVLPSTFKVKK